MAFYSQLNARNFVVRVLECDENILLVQEKYGGMWIEYEVNGTHGVVGKKYSSEYDIFIEASKPVDHDGDVCNSWTLNTTTGFYEPPFISPVPTQEEDTAGLSYYWDESAYQSDESNPKTEGWVLGSGPELRPDHGTCYDENGNPYDCRHWL